MAITLKLNSGGFVRCLTRSDLELTPPPQKKIPLATKRLDYTDHKHFFKKTPPLNTITGCSLCESRSKTPRGKAKYLFILKEKNFKRKKKLEKRRRKKRPHFRWVSERCISSHSDPLCFPSSCLKGAWRGYYSVDKSTLLLGRRARHRARKLPFGWGFLYVHPYGIFFFFFLLPCNYRTVFTWNYKNHHHHDNFLKNLYEKFSI